MIYNMDALEFLKRTNPVKCLFADIPDNIGQAYLSYNDKKPTSDYYNWVNLLILEALPKCQVFWLAYYPKYDLELSWMVRDIIKQRHPTFAVDKYLWRYTFSQYNANDCAYGYRPIMRFCRAGVMYPEAILEKSKRQLLGDKRANPEGRVPDNVWDIPRIVGNSPERVDWMPNQLPIDLLKRVMAFSVNKNEVFVDLFGGSGSALMAAKDLGRVDTTHVVEIDPTTCWNMHVRTGVECLTTMNS